MHSETRCSLCSPRVSPSPHCCCQCWRDSEQQRLLCVCWWWGRGRERRIKLYKCFIKSPYLSTKCALFFAPSLRCPATVDACGMLRLHSPHIAAHTVHLASSFINFPTRCCCYLRHQVSGDRVACGGVRAAVALAAKRTQRTPSRPSFLHHLSHIHTHTS